MKINPDYQKRRDLFLQQLGPKRVAVIGGASESIRNGNVTYPFRQSSDLFYLTGFLEADTVAVFTPQREKSFSLFVKPRDLHHERYTGPKAGLEEAINDYGADQAFSLAELPTQLYLLLDGYEEVVTSLGENEKREALLLKTIADLRKSERHGARAPYQLTDIKKILHDQRLIKDQDAIISLKRAIEITTLAHLRIMKELQPHQTEHEISARLNYFFESQEGYPGYENIVAQGNNATILHYHQGRQPLVGGQLLLVDAGCEWQGFTADVTRVYPIPIEAGKPARFSGPQRRLYDCVLHAQKAGIQAAKPGSTLELIYKACSRSLTEGLIDIGILQGTADDLLAENKHKAYSLHHTCHFLGMDVHDVGEYFPNGEPRILTDGMVFTIEPGLYIPLHSRVKEEYRGIGIRIEDDLLITSSKPEGHEVLTAAIPKDPGILESMIGISS